MGHRTQKRSAGSADRAGERAPGWLATDPGRSLLEREADRVADRIAPQPIPLGTLSPSSGRATSPTTLPAPALEHLGGVFDFDFSAVRVHHSAEAADDASRRGASAFTRDHDITFGAGEYRTDMCCSTPTDASPSSPDQPASSDTGDTPTARAPTPPPTPRSRLNERTDHPRVNEIGGGHHLTTPNKTRADPPNSSRDESGLAVA